MSPVKLRKRIVARNYKDLFLHMNEQKFYVLVEGQPGSLVYRVPKSVVPVPKAAMAPRPWTRYSRRFLLFFQDLQLASPSLRPFQLRLLNKRKPEESEEEEEEVMPDAPDSREEDREEEPRRVVLDLSMDCDDDGEREVAEIKADEEPIARKRVTGEVYHHRARKLWTSLQGTLGAVGAFERAANARRSRVLARRNRCAQKWAEVLDRLSAAR